MTESHTSPRTGTNRPTKGGNGARPLPYHEQAERSLLGAALISNDARDVLATINPADFYIAAHQHIATAIIVEHVSGHPVDPVTIAHALQAEELLDSAGGPATLVALQAECPASSSAGRYAEIVVDHARRRRAIYASDELIQRATTGHPFDDLLEQLTDAQAHAGTDELELEDVNLALTDIFDDTPTILRRTDGNFLLYENAVNVIHAEPGHLKSWIGLCAVAEVIHGGGDVLFLDYEDNLRRIARRLVALGATPDELVTRFHYKRMTALSPAGIAALPRLARNLHCRLVVIDGLAEALAAQGHDENAASDVVAWWVAVPRPLSATGAAVLIIDHVTKSKEGRARWGRGSGAKLGALDGIAYAVELVEGLSRRKQGKVRLIIGKDRPGFVGAEGEAAAALTFTPTNDGDRIDWLIEPVVHADWQGPTDCMAVVERFFREHPDQHVPRSRIAEQIRAIYGSEFSYRDRVARDAADRLVALGTLEEKPGTRNARLYQLRKDPLDLELGEF